MLAGFPQQVAMGGISPSPSSPVKKLCYNALRSLFLAAVIAPVLLFILTSHSLYTEVQSILILLTFNFYRMLFFPFEWKEKTFEWSKWLFLRFPPSYKLRKIYHPPPVRGSPTSLFGKPWSEACRDMHQTMVLVQSTQHNFSFKFSFWYVYMSGYRLLPPTSC